MKTYTAVAERSGDWWAISVPEVRGVFTQAKRLEQVESTAREAIALLLDAPEDEVGVEVEVRLPRDLSERRQNLYGLREVIEETRRNYGIALAETVMSLQKELGLSIRDVASIVGVSFQRVGQVVEESLGDVQIVRGRKAAPRKAAARKVAAQKLASRAAAASGRKTVRGAAMAVPKRAGRTADPMVSKTGRSKIS